MATPEERLEQAERTVRRLFTTLKEATAATERALGVLANPGRGDQYDPDDPGPPPRVADGAHREGRGGRRGDRGRAAGAERRRDFGAGIRRRSAAPAVPPDAATRRGRRRAPEGRPPAAGRGEDDLEP
jgi:hypothetical protein